jgi:ABC-type uncharacterized transport system auxiliary subunit
LIYKSLTLITEKRTELLQDLVAYTNDPIRYARRIRILTQLAQYEYELISKINNFESEEASDFDYALSNITNEIISITNTSA